MSYFISILAGITISLVGSVFVASAQGYDPLVTLPGVTKVGTQVGMGEYLAGMMKFIIALAGVFAILMAIIGGTQYVAAGISPNAKGEAKERITNAFIGLILVLVSYLILNSINPKLVKFELLLPPISGPAVTAPAPGVPTPTTPAPTPPVGRVDSAIEALNLSPVAKAGAYSLKTQIPSVVFTSGTRSPADQARAMAQNVASNRQFIVQTYAATSARTKLQAWVNANPSATSVTSITAGLLSVINSLTSAEVASISRHLSGNAFDVQPVSTNAEQIKAAIRALPGLTLFLEREAGLVRWHAQF